MRIPPDLEEEIEAAALVYQLSRYLFSVKRKFGQVLSEKTHAHILLLSAFDSKLESQIPRFLDIMTKAEYACALRNTSQPTDDIVTNLVSTLAGFTLIECGCSDERQKALHAAVGAHVGSACVLAYEVFASEIDAIKGISTEFQWRMQPGPFERQLQRQQGNPLFPRPARLITAARVSAARLEDLRLSADFPNSFRPLVRHALSLPPQRPLKEVSNFWKKVTDLIILGKTIGGYFSEEVQTLEKTGETVENLLGRTVNPDNLKTYRALSAVEGLMHRMTLALGPKAGLEDELRTVLSEDCETISAFGRISASGFRSGNHNLQLAERIIHTAMRDGLGADVALPKLNAFRAGFVSEKPKASSKIWRALRKGVRRASSWSSRYRWQ
jgi:hypothetical protein